MNRRGAAGAAAQIDRGRPGPAPAGSKIKPKNGLPLSPAQVGAVGGPDHAVTETIGGTLEFHGYEAFALVGTVQSAVRPPQCSLTIGRSNVKREATVDDLSTGNAMW